MFQEKILTFEEFVHPSEELFYEVWKTKLSVGKNCRIFYNFPLKFIGYLEGKLGRDIAMDHLNEKEPLLKKQLTNVMASAYFKGKGYDLTIEKNLANFYQAYLTMREVVNNNLDLFS